MSRSKSGKDAAERIDRIQRALQLRRSGASYVEIGKALKCSGSSAWRYVWAGLKQLKKLNAKEAASVKEIELARLDFYLRSLDDRIRKGDSKAVNAAVRISERRSRLLGIDKPQEVKVNVVPDLIAKFKDGDEEAERKLAHLAATGEIEE